MRHGVVKRGPDQLRWCNHKKTIYRIREVDGLEGDSSGKRRATVATGEYDLHERVYRVLERNEVSALSFLQKLRTELRRAPSIMLAFLSHEVSNTSQMQKDTTFIVIVLRRVDIEVTYLT